MQNFDDHLHFNITGQTSSALLANVYHSLLTFNWMLWHKMVFWKSDGGDNLAPVKSPDCVVRKFDPDYKEVGFVMAWCLAENAVLNVVKSCPSVCFLNFFLGHVMHFSFFLFGKVVLQSFPPIRRALSYEWLRTPTVNEGEVFMAWFY